MSPVLVRGELILTLLLNVLVSLPEPTFLPENFKKKDVVEILSHKKAYNACEYEYGWRVRFVISCDVDV